MDGAALSRHAGQGRLDKPIAQQEIGRRRMPSHGAGLYPAPPAYFLPYRIQPSATAFIVAMSTSHCPSPSANAKRPVPPS